MLRLSLVIVLHAKMDKYLLGYLAKLKFFANSAPMIMLRLPLVIVLHAQMEKCLAKLKMFANSAPMIMLRLSLDIAFNAKMDGFLAEIELLATKVASMLQMPTVMMKLILRPAHMMEETAV